MLQLKALLRHLNPTPPFGTSSECTMHTRRYYEQPQVHMGGLGSLGNDIQVASDTIRARALSLLVC